MRAVAVLPFATEDLDLGDLAFWLTALTAAALPGAQQVIDSVEISPAALGEAAAQLSAGFALGAALARVEDRVEISALLVAASGEVKEAWDLSEPLGLALQFPRMLARAALVALGEPEPAATVEPPLPDEAVLSLARAHRRLSEDGSVDEDLFALAHLPAARILLLDAARAALGTERMPAFFSALERLAQVLPDDPSVLLALADYRAAHFDDGGAREAYLAARDTAEDPLLSADAAAGLASLAQRAGRRDEAILQLRSAVRMADRADLYARLAALLFERDSAEALRMLTRATVLAPDDAELHLSLARALREHGGDKARALAAVARAAELCPADSPLSEELRLEVQLLLTT